MFTTNYYNMLQLAATLQISHTSNTNPSWPSSIPQILNSNGYYLCSYENCGNFTQSGDIRTVAPSVGMPFLHSWIRFTTETSASEDDYTYPSEVATVDYGDYADLNVEVDGDERYLNVGFTRTYSNNTSSAITFTAFKVMKSLFAYWNNNNDTLTTRDVVIVSQVLDTPITLAVGERKKLTVQFKIPLNY